jgi:endonuclease-3
VKRGGTAERRNGGTAEPRNGGRPKRLQDSKQRNLSKVKKGKASPRNTVPPSRRSAPPADLFSRLKELYPDAKCALNYRNAFELLCATILSAQCTDARVNLVTPALFARYPTAFELAQANPLEVQEIIKSAGFFRNKTRSLIGMAQAIVGDHGGEVPRTMDELRKLPGVGRKTANVILGNAYNVNEGVTVDTHVGRLSGLLGLSGEKDPVKIEQELMRLFPQDDWALLSHLLIFHGRQVCVARRPRCSDCVLSQLCPSSLV